MQAIISYEFTSNQGKIIKKFDVPIGYVPVESALDTKPNSETDEEFYDRASQKLAKKYPEEKRQQLLITVGPKTFPNGSFVEFVGSTSRPPPTPPAGLVEEERKKSKSKSKSKKRKKKKSDRARVVVEEPSNILGTDVPIPRYYQQSHQQQLLTTPTSAPRDSPAASPPMTPAAVGHGYSKMKSLKRDGTARRESSYRVLKRVSKRRRVPNKFYGYSSDEDAEKASTPKWRKTEASFTPRSPLIVPPITLKRTPQQPPPSPQVVEPISIRRQRHRVERQQLG